MSSVHHYGADMPGTQWSCCLVLHKNNLWEGLYEDEGFMGKFVYVTYHPWDMSSMKGLTLPELRDLFIYYYSTNLVQNTNK